ncbi:MAG: hypothetical protein ACHQM6_08860, partial [Candidatus Kapaibacterium sp.]
MPVNSKLYQYNKHLHEPRNINKAHAEEQQAGGFNARLAVWLTKHVGTMWTAYSFLFISLIGLLAILGVLSPIVALLIAWVSQTFLQLVLLPIIMVGQNVLGRKSELMAEEQFNTTMKTYHDIEEIMIHLSAQDAELLKQTAAILEIQKRVDAK